MTIFLTNIAYVEDIEWCLLGDAAWRKGEHSLKMGIGFFLNIGQKITC